MRKRALLLAVVTTGLAGCSTEPVACSDNLVAITATVVNRTGEVLPSPQVIDTVVRTGAVVELSASGQGPALGVDSAQPAVILTDDFLGLVRPAGDAVVVTVRAADHVARGEYVFGSACHVHKLAGPDSLLLY